MRLQDYEFRRLRVKGQQVNKTTRQQDLHTCGLVVSLSCCLQTLVNRLFAKTKRAFEDAKAGRTLVILYLIYIGLSITPHIITVLSSEPLAKYFPSGLQLTEVTVSESPFKFLSLSPLFASHIIMIPSFEPLAKYFPSGLQQTEPTPYECPSKVFSI